VRPRIAPRKSCFSFFRITKGSSQLFVGPAVSFESEQMNVRSTKLNEKLWPGCFLARSTPNDVGEIVTLAIE
jgi:hypothetical protein